MSSSGSHVLVRIRVGKPDTATLTFRMVEKMLDMILQDIWVVEVPLAQVTVTLGVCRSTMLHEPRSRGNQRQAFSLTSV